MDSLFNTVLQNIPEKYEITCYYIVDDDLRYVSIHNADTFYLHYVDTDRISDVIKSCDLEGAFDYCIISLNKPIEYQKSNYEDIRGSLVRVVRTKSCTGNQKIIKHKESSDRQILNRFISKRKSLF